MINSKYCVIGLGRFGAKIARQLAIRGAEVIALDNINEKVESLKDDVAQAITCDSSDLKILKDLKINECDAVIVAIGEDFESLILTVVNCLELKAKKIIARAGSSHQKLILEKLGINDILSPEEEVGNIVAERLIHPDFKTFLQLPDSYEIAEIKAPKNIHNKAVSDINFETEFNLSLITIKRLFEIKDKNEIKKEFHIIGAVMPNTIIYSSDELILLGKELDIERFIQLNK